MPPNKERLEALHKQFADIANRKIRPDVLEALRAAAAQGLHAECIQPYELDAFTSIEHLPPPRKAHVVGCDFCQTLYAAAKPEPAKEAARAKEVAVAAACRAEIDEAIFNQYEEESKDKYGRRLRRYAPVAIGSLLAVFGLVLGLPGILRSKPSEQPIASHETAPSEKGQPKSSDPSFERALAAKVQTPANEHALDATTVQSLVVPRTTDSERLRSLRQQIRKNPTDAGAYVNLMKQLGQEGRWSEATTASWPAMRFNANDPDIRNQVSRVWTQAERSLLGRE